MSEYQYYEFQALDRRLTAGEMAELRAFSTRARITSTSFVNDYQWGGFKGNENAWRGVPRSRPRCGTPTDYNSPMRESQRRYTVEDYYFVDAGSPIRHEYFHGEIYAMSGGTRVHARIAGNVFAAFHTALRGTACEPFSSDMRLMTPSGLYTYPDVSVVCGQREVIGLEERTTLLNPVVLVEVLSDSTREYGRGEKFEMYRSIASLRDYVLIEQSRPWVEHRRRSLEGEWTSFTAQSLDQVVRLASIEVDLPLAGIYERVEFPR